MTGASKVTDMKRLTILLPLLLLLALSAFAQDGKADPSATPQASQQDTRGNMLREIGLSPEQLRQMRRLNVERKPLMEEAQRSLRQANRLLDEAIYADEVNDTLVQSRLKEAQAAQAEVFRIRSSNELAIRRILTSDQLIRFRDLRQRFEEEARQNIERRRNENRQNRNASPTGEQFRTGPKRLRPLIRQGQPQKQP